MLLADASEEMDDHDCVELSTPQPAFMTLPSMMLIWVFLLIAPQLMLRRWWSGRLTLACGAPKAELVALTVACKCELDIMKVKAHPSSDSNETQGNRLADSAAKSASSLCSSSYLRSPQIASLINTESNKTDISVLPFKVQASFSCWEIWTGCKSLSRWSLHQRGKIITLESLLPYLATQIHFLSHIRVDQISFHTFGGTLSLRPVGQVEEIA